MAYNVFSNKQFKKVVVSTVVVASSLGLVHVYNEGIVYAAGTGSILISHVPTVSNGYNAEATQLRLNNDEMPFLEGNVFHVVLPSGVTWNNSYSSEGTVTDATYKRLDDREIQFTVTGNPTEIVIPLHVKIDGVGNGALNLRVDAPPSSSIPVGQATFAYVSGVVEPPIGGGEPLNPVEYRAFINEVEVLTDGLYETNGVILGSIRPLVNGLVIQATWDNDTRQITFSSEEKTLVLTVGSKEYLLNGNVGTLGVAPQIVNERIMIPMQFVVETFGGRIEFVSSNSNLITVSVPTLSNGFNGEATQLRVKSHADLPFTEGDQFYVRVRNGVIWNQSYESEGMVTNATYRRVDDTNIQFTVTGTTNEIVVPLNVKIEGASNGALDLIVEAPPSSSIPVGRVTFANVAGAGELPSEGGKELLYPVAYRVFINESEVILDGSLYEINGVVLGLLGTVARGLGVEATWDNDTRQITFSSEEKTLVLTVGSKEYLLNGNVGTLDVAPQIVNNRVVIPMQFVVETFGGSIEFRSSNNYGLQIMSVPTLNNGFNGEATQLRLRSYDNFPFVEGDQFYVRVSEGVAWNDSYRLDGTVTNATYQRVDDRTIWFTVRGNPTEIVIPLHVKIDGVGNGALNLRVDAPSNSSVPIGLATFANVAEVSNGKDILEIVSALIESGKNSNDFVEHSIINLDNLLNGTILITKYSGVDELKSEKTWTVNSQSKSEATDKITRFIFELTNRYRPETELVLSVSEDKTIIHTYTVGEKKERAMLAITEGLKDALKNAPITDQSDNTWVDKYNPEVVGAVEPPSDGGDGNGNGGGGGNRKRDSGSNSSPTSSNTTSGQIDEILKSIKTNKEFQEIKKQYKTDRELKDFATQLYNKFKEEENTVSDKVFVLETISQLYLESGAFKEALEVQEKAVKENLNNVDGYKKLAKIMEANGYKGVKAFVNGSQPEFDVQPFIKGERTLIPFRVISEALNAQVEWIPENKTVVVYKGETEIRLTIGSNIATVNGREILLDVPAQIVQGRTVVPLGFLGKSLGANVIWEEETKSVIVIDSTVKNSLALKK